MIKKKNSTKQISGRLEKKLAKKLNGKTTIGSGCFYFDQCDIRVNNFMIEHKYTQKDVYHITDKVLSKNELEAYSSFKSPVLIVEFIDQYEKLLGSFCIYKVIEENANNIKKVKRYSLTRNLNETEYFTFDNNAIYKIERLELTIESNYFNIE